MQLYYTVYGSNVLPSLIILHGLLGSSDNWQSFGKNISSQYRAFIPDARNHGRSPHAGEMNYSVMTDDVKDFLHQQELASASLLGHSMGGKTACLTALRYPDMVDKLVVVDIAPRPYGVDRDQYLHVLMSLDLGTFHTRGEIQASLSQRIQDVRVVQFLMKNIQQQTPGVFTWKMNLPSIQQNLQAMYDGFSESRKFHKPALFIRGEESDYIQMEDLPAISNYFPAAEIVTLKNAGHWVHADAPAEFMKEVLDFLSD